MLRAPWFWEPSSTGILDKLAFFVYAFLQNKAETDNVS